MIYFSQWSRNTRCRIYVRFTVVVVVDSHIQRIILATDETTVTQQVSHRPIDIKCQSRLWSQRGTKVNGSRRHDDNPLLRPTRIQIATKSYATLQAMAPTNIKTVHQTSLLHIESNLDRLGLLSPNCSPPESLPGKDVLCRLLPRPLPSVCFLFFSFLFRPCSPPICFGETSSIL